MAYAALTSLANTIDQLLNDNKNFVPLEVKPQFITVHEYVTYFQAFVENFPDNDLKERMRELAYETEGFIEDLSLVKVRSSSDHEANYHTLHRMYKHRDMEKVIEEIDSIAREISEIKQSFRSRGVEDGAASSSSTAPAPPIHEDAMVGFEDHEMDVKGRLCGEETKLQVIPICGMGGIGKTILAKNVYDDPLITESFDIRVWVTISQDYSKERVLSSLRESLKEFNMGGSGRIDEDAVYHQVL